MIRWLIIAICLVLTSAPAFAQGTDVVTYYFTDAIGSVRAITDATGQVLRTHDYLPFGEEWGTQPPDARMFAGKERDAETQFDYFGGRYYTKGPARFTTVDPVVPVQAALLDPQRWNRYTYVANRPLQSVDPDGRTIWDLLDVLAVGASAYQVWQDPHSVSAWTSLGGDLVGAALPVIPAPGTVSRITRAAERLARNKAAGEAAERAVVGEVIAEGGTVLGRQVCCSTAVGRRRIDLLTEQSGEVAAIEVKSGSATRSGLQRAKDAEIEAGRGTFVGKNAPETLRNRQVPVWTVERKPKTLYDEEP